MTNEYRDVVITPEAWGDLYTLIKPFIAGLAAWGEKHDQPISVAIGVAWGAGEILATIGNACDCELCEEVTMSIAEELTNRLVDTLNAVRH